MNVLVTGGAGFIGSHLCEALLESGHSVLAIDNFSTGVHANLDAISNRPEFELLEGDIRDRSTLLPAKRPDVIFHLAAAVGVRTILEKPLESLETNLKGTDNVLHAAAEWQTPVLVASTSEVYGKNEAERLDEQADRVLGSGDLARWWYAVAKMADEALVLASHRAGKLQGLIVRLFNTVGPRQTGRYGMVLPTLVRQALSGRPLTVFGDGEQTRCFTFVSDCVSALIALAETPAAFGLTFNIGQSTEISINSLATRVLALTGSDSTVTHVPYEQAYGPSFEDMRRRVPDCSLLHKTIGFGPTNRLDEAILAVADYYRGTSAR